MLNCCKRVLTCLLIQEIIYVHEMTTAYSTVIGIKVDKGQGTLMKNFTVAYEVLGKSADADSDYILANNVATFIHDELHHNISILVRRLTHTL